MPSGTGRAMRQLTSCAASTPMTMVSWLMATSKPRLAAGAISEMYIGEMFEARPMLTPPRIRQATKAGKLWAIAMPREEIDEVRRGHDEEWFAPEPVTEGAGSQRAGQTPQQGATLGPAGRRNGIGPDFRPKAGIGRDLHGRVFQLEKGLVKLGRSPDDHPVVAEEQAAHRRDQRDHPDVTHVHERELSLTARNMARIFSVGTLLCTLWVLLKTNPPPSLKISMRSRTSR